jgi:hypothetical protein
VEFLVKITLTGVMTKGEAKTDREAKTGGVTQTEPITGGSTRIGVAIVVTVATATAEAVMTAIMTTTGTNNADQPVRHKTE